jgi:cytochrome c oxidase assembly protein subunit 15
VALKKYRQIPQYQHINKGMSLEAFKRIFWWEWSHRFLARFVGVAFLVPFLFFLAMGRIARPLIPKLAGLFALGGLQGAIGWWMVESGIVNDVKVSHFRLSAHLLTALFTLGGLVWTARDLLVLEREPAGRPARLAGFGAMVLAALGLQLLLGAWVAGMRAGVVAGGGWFNWDAWPLMQGKLFPDGIDWGAGTVSALGHDPFLIHFLHRWWAWVVVAALVIFSRKLKPIDRRPSIAIHAAFGLQILLGIATVETGMNIFMAALHQAVGASLVAAVTWGAHAYGRSSR